MRKILTVIAVLIAAPAVAAESSCADIAQSAAQLFSSFPEVKPGTEESLVTWRAACAEAPPTGDGKVVALCQAETDGPGVFYWLKAGERGEVAGFLTCV